ncbi:hypothetical protein I7I51_02250 [Histoplasma capsulatum]|uniref:Uncharacterized protein n=1 Tax=Ajellomyces capsulatus TaxID=5037 RepID=A0A8A1MCR8_AJECA|nr:predicted protein [Histoplasma mississippiense (nom. inval.)]EDN09723.1 predicted protein [Histoplasma mississippiense (nom. inval.)]QSS62513.1 hypothetical protein I7I51_02250 [Histoplasma capsulatum]
MTTHSAHGRSRGGMTHSTAGIHDTSAASSALSNPFLLMVELHVMRCFMWVKCAASSFLRTIPQPKQRAKSAPRANPSLRGAKVKRMPQIGDFGALSDGLDKLGDLNQNSLLPRERPCIEPITIKGLSIFESKAGL